MQRLRHGDEVDGCVRDPALTLVGDAIVDAWVCPRARELSLAAIGRDHFLKMLRQGERRLSRARGAIPSGVVPRRQLGERREEGRGIARPKAVVSGGRAEVILEVAQLRPGYLRRRRVARVQSGRRASTQRLIIKGRSACRCRSQSRESAWRRS